MTKDGQQVLSSAEAAEYLGTTLANLKYHLYKARTLKPDYIIGKSLAFKRQTLDQFREKHQAEGLTVKEAAEYLGISLDKIRTAIYHHKTLKPDGKRALNIVFKKKTLDRYWREHLSDPSE